MSSEAFDGVADEYARQSLFVMSAVCEHPTLTPECPFSVEVRPGVRTCQEQCHEILQAHGLPLPKYEDAPRAAVERRPSSVAAAFDASAEYLQAQDRRPSRWPLPALIWALRQHLMRVPVAMGDRSREEEIELILAELARQDFNVEGLVRLGLGDDIGEALLFGTLLSRLVRAGGGVDGPDGGEAALVGPEIPERWHGLLDEVLTREPDAATLELPFVSMPAEERRATAEAGRVLRGSFRTRLNAWVLTAPLADVVALHPPEWGDFGTDAGAAQPTAAERHRQQWLVDRFTVAYYDQWRPESRKLEYRWLQDAEAPPCSPGFMDCRERREDDLARTIAVSAAFDPVGPEGHLARLKFKGVQLLKAGRRAEAGAIFEGMRELNWDLPEPHNDFGCAILPDAPEAALAALDVARGLGYRRTLNEANRALAFALLGRDDDVFALAEGIAANYDSEDGDGSILWEPPSTLAGAPALSDELLSPRDYVLEVAALVAERASDHVAAMRWRGELGRRSEDPPAASA